MKKIKQWIYFHILNPVVREGHTEAFRWVFRRYWLEISTASGNWKVRFTADEHPYGYLLAGKDDDNIVGFCQMLYYLGMVITTDQGLVDDIGRAVAKYEKRIEKKAAGAVEENDGEERAALEEMKAAQEYVDAGKKGRRKLERAADRKLKKSEKSAAYVSEKSE